jgi:hypothetical protein
MGMVEERIAGTVLDTLTEVVAPAALGIKTSEMMVVRVIRRVFKRNATFLA